MKPFEQLSIDEKMVLIRAFYEGKQIQVRDVHPNWYSCTPTWQPERFYRIKPEELQIPWDIIKPEYKWAAMNKDGRVWIYTSKPSHPRTPEAWSLGPGELAVMNHIIFPDYTGHWTESLTERPKK